MSTPWYRVPEVWLMLGLLAGSVAGSFTLIAFSRSHPDVHYDVGANGRFPPAQRAPDAK